MTHKFITGVTKLLKPLFVNGFTREFTRSFMDPDVNLELQLNEICSNCPLHTTAADDNGSGLDLIAVDVCRMKYFGQLLQSFVGRPGDDETIKLYAYLKKCEDCITSKLKYAFELKKSRSVIKN
ncbi:MAG: hypothetical protein JW762_01500 [Dehalococcoidales bacterium]|nr:hypothetical protein [Dehalococcoidales bacterium]